MGSGQVTKALWATLGGSDFILQTHSGVYIVISMKAQALVLTSVCKNERVLNRYS